MNIKNDYKANSIPDLFNKLSQHPNKDGDDYTAVDECLGILKLYYDGIYEHGRKRFIYNYRAQKEKQTLEELLSGCKTIVGRVHSGYELRSSDLQQVLSLKKEVSTYASSDVCNYRHLAKDNLTAGLVDYLEKICNEIGYFDSVFYVASGGAEPALLYCARKGGLPIPIRFSKCRMHDANVVIPKSLSIEYLSEKIRGKRVLVVEDIMMSGQSLKKVMEYIYDYKPKELYGCAVYGVEDFNFKNMRKITDVHSSDGRYIFHVVSDSV